MRVINDLNKILFFFKEYNRRKNQTNQKATSKQTNIPITSKAA